jgi:hypothetical protein
MKSVGVALGVVVVLIDSSPQTIVEDAEIVVEGELEGDLALERLTDGLILDADGEGTGDGLSSMW